MPLSYLYCRFFLYFCDRIFLTVFFSFSFLKFSTFWLNITWFFTTITKSFFVSFYIGCRFFLRLTVAVFFLHLYSSINFPFMRDTLNSQTDSQTDSQELSRVYCKNPVNLRVLCQFRDFYLTVHSNLFICLFFQSNYKNDPLCHHFLEVSR